VQPVYAVVNGDSDSEGTCECLRPTGIVVEGMDCLDLVNLYRSQVQCETGNYSSVPPCKWGSYERRLLEFREGVDGVLRDHHINFARSESGSPAWGFV